jgi:hypothetical protein
MTRALRAKDETAPPGRTTPAHHNDETKPTAAEILAFRPAPMGRNFFLPNEAKCRRLFKDLGFRTTNEAKQPFGVNDLPANPPRAAGGLVSSRLLPA